MTESHAIDRQKKIVQILSMLHEGGNFETAKQIFDETFDGVDVSEITNAERELIATGLNPMEIQTLCNVHAAVFRGKINNNTKTPTEAIPGHPVQVLKLENTVLMSLLNDELLPTLKKWQQSGSDPTLLTRMQNALADLAKIDHHYLRKENLIFPLMTKYGITAPPKVMWGVDDEIRGWIKAAQQLVNADPLPDKYAIEKAIEKAAKEVDEMVFKEEEIMLPMNLEVFTPSDWAMIQRESDPIGYTLIAQPLPWQPTAEELATKPKPSKLAKELNAMAEQLAQSQELASQRPQAPTDRDVLAEIHNGTPMPVAPAATVAKLQKAQTADGDNEKHVPSISVQKPKQSHNTHRGPAVFGAATSESDSGRIEIDGIHPARVLLPTGSMDLGELTNVLRLLPLDLTFVDATDTVRWFSDSGERVFPRTTAVIGRLVKDCHPPKSVDKVEKILHDFHAGKQDHADFWINLHHEKMVYIRYFAIRNPAGAYLGCLEVTQDISKIQQLEGEKRLGD
ncbi:DUF438 domain-containing protein [Lacticaseibacillus baoqingensis]|uniref:DUF438 domain-containing protein n=1 Tax=Lacticaseibacillus baoqingensis TaxID=2486013 RepID=A0ABW4E251_9LACO|nr:DUF438 domain-containing protein [Lacticaseibacillus baoqingensis]